MIAGKEKIWHSKTLNWWVPAPLHHSIVLVLVLVLVSARDMAFQDLELVGSNPIASAMADNKEEAAFR